MVSTWLTILNIYINIQTRLRKPTDFLSLVLCIDIVIILNKRFLLLKIKKKIIT